MDAQEPFYKGSGLLLDKSFAKAGVEKKKLFLTNVVHCHPPRNRDSLDLWIRRCSSYLHEELEIVQPKVVIGLGEDAAQAPDGPLPEVSEFNNSRARVRQAPLLDTSAT